MHASKTLRRPGATPYKRVAPAQVPYAAVAVNDLRFASTAARRAYDARH